MVGNDWKEYRKIKREKRRSKGWRIEEARDRE
jgi:hypothetical protein